MEGKVVPVTLTWVRPMVSPGAAGTPVCRVSALHLALGLLSLETVSHWVPLKGHKLTGMP